MKFIALIILFASLVSAVEPHDQKKAGEKERPIGPENSFNPLKISFSDAEKQGPEVTTDEFAARESALYCHDGEEENTYRNRHILLAIEQRDPDKKTSYLHKVKKSAELALDSARRTNDPFAMAMVFYRYPFTPAADQAMLELLSLLADEGNPLLVQWFFDGWYGGGAPQNICNQPGIEIMKLGAGAYLRQGDAEHANDLAERLRVCDSDFADAFKEALKKPRGPSFATSMGDIARSAHAGDWEKTRAALGGTLYRMLYGEKQLLKEVWQPGHHLRELTKLAAVYSDSGEEIRKTFKLGICDVWEPLETLRGQRFNVEKGRRFDPSRAVKLFEAFPGLQERFASVVADDFVEKKADGEKLIALAYAHPSFGKQFYDEIEKRIARDPVHASFAMARIDSNRYVADLRKLSHHEHSGVRCLAYSDLIFRNLIDESFRDDFVEALESGDQKLREVAARGLTHLSDSSEVDAKILKLFQTGKVSSNAFFDSGKHEKWAGLLAPGIDAKDERLRSETLRVMNNFGDDAKVAIPQLTKQLEVEAYRRSALQTLKNIGPDAGSAKHAIMKLLDDEDRDLVRDALVSLREMDPALLEKEGRLRRYIPHATPLLLDEDQPAIKKAVQRIAKDLTDSNERRKDDTLEVITMFGEHIGDESIPHLIDMLKDDSHLREVFKALSKKTGQILGEPLQTEYANEASMLRLAQVDYKQKLSTALRPHFEAMLKSDDAKIREYGAEGLAELEKKTAKK